MSEFKAMVRTLHEAGVEVILDVVYNHAAEGNHLGPTLSFKGIDNAAYYRLVPDIYQGTELWDLSLVDPDNRRSVDWELHLGTFTPE